VFSDDLHPDLLIIYILTRDPLCTLLDSVDAIMVNN